MAFWLFKSEPTVFSIDHLRALPTQTTCWDGVRNFQARNYLKSTIAVGEQVFFYHSNVEPMAIVGVCRVVRSGYPDPSQFNPKSKYFDPDSRPDAPRWYVVDVKLERAFAQPIPRELLKTLPELSDMMLLKRGARLSVQPVAENEWHAIMALAK